MEAELLALRAENEKLRARVAELEQETALYRTLFEELPISASLFRADGLMIDLNRRNRELFGVPSREGFVGHYNMFHDPAAAKQGYADAMRRAIEEEPGKVVFMELNLGPDDDHPFWTRASLQGVDVGGVRYVIGVIVDITERIRAERAATESRAFLGAIIENAPVQIDVKDREGRYLLVNEAFERLFSLGRAEVLGKTDRELFPDDAAMYAEIDRAALLSSVPYAFEDYLTVDGKRYTYITTKFALRDGKGERQAVCSIALDITERKEAEAEAQRLQEEMFRVQAATLRALSTPLLPIAEGVVVMPLIGSLDAVRAQQVLETLLDGIVAHKASQVILDVTGVPTVDAQVASALLQTAQAVRLLGAQVVLTGIQPAIARTLIELGANLGGMQTRSTLESGIASAIAARGGGKRA